MDFRQANPTDAADIAAIWNREIRDGVATFSTREMTVAEIETMIAEEGTAVQVAVVSGELIGFARFYPFRGGVGYRFTKEHSIYLEPKAQGMGAGRALMQRVCHIAKQEGVHSLMAAISSENPAGVAFHKTLGFEQVARVPEVGHKFGRWMDLILMQKFL